MEVEELEILKEEKLRLLEIQVAALISDVLMLKAWKSEMSKLNLPLDISSRQSEAVVPTSDIKQGQVTRTIMKTANDQKTTQECSGTRISCIQPEAVVPTSDLKQEQVMSDTTTGRANNQRATQSSDTSISCIQLESVVPASDVKQGQEAIQSSDKSITFIQPGSVVPASDVNQGQVVIMETAEHQKTAQECSDTSISCIQLESVVPASDVKQGQVLNDTTTKTANHQEAIQSSDANISCVQPGSVVTASDVNQGQVVIMETAEDQKTAQECFDTSISCIQPEAMLPTSDVKQDQVISNKIRETPNGQIGAEKHSDTRTSENVDCISSGSTVENADAEKCKNETPDLECEVEETTALSDKDAPAVQVVTAVDTQEGLSETDGAAKESKTKNSWIALIEEEEQESLPSECVPSGQEMKQSSSKTSQLGASVTIEESKEQGGAPCKIGNKHSVLENLVKSTVQYSSSECGNKRHTAMTSSNKRFDIQNTDNVICSSDKQNSMATNVQANQENDSKQKLQSKDKPKIVEKNALFAYMMKHKTHSQHKKEEEEEEQIMQDTSVTIKEKKCPTCQCKTAPKDTKDSEEDNNNSKEKVKKMSPIKLQKKYLQLEKRHQKLINAICDPSTLTQPDDPHALLNAARDGNVEEAILFTFSATMMDFRDEDGYAPLHLAVWNEHIPICKLLLAYNMPASVKDNQGNTPLHFAARKGNVEICKVLLNWLAPLNATNTFGTTPLHCAVKDGHNDVCFLLVSKGASMSLGDKWNNTALHMAACNGFLDICQFLVEQGVDVNVQNSMGCTPLHNACKAGHFVVVKFLVRNGAGLSIKCNKGKTPKEVINTVIHSSLLEWVTKWEKRICSDLSSILNFN